MYKKTIWMYWENRNGSTKPPYLELCLETIKCHKGSFEVKLLNEKTVKNYIDLPPIVNKFTEIAHKADYIRFMLLHKYGGIWLDSDIILLRNIDAAIIMQLEKFDYVGYGREKGKPSIGFMAARKNSRIIENHLRKVDSILKNKKIRFFFNKKVKLGWGEIGYDVFWSLSSKYNYYHHDYKLFAPILWSDFKEFDDDNINLNNYLMHKPFAVMLYNKMMFDTYQDFSSNSIINGNSLLSKLFNTALSNCTQKK